MNWHKIKNTSTEPINYIWVNNGKSRFKKGYESRLIKINKQVV